MKADISATTFGKEKHYRKVIVQQGRVQTDADSNEQIDIQVYHERTFLQDIIGRTGAPTEKAGFEIKVDPSKPGYTIGAGHYYVEGILCENENDVQASDQADLRTSYFIWDEIFSNEQAGTRFKSFLKRIFILDWIDSEGVQIESTDDGKTIRIHTPANDTGSSNSISITLDDDPSKATKATLKDDTEVKVIYVFVAKGVSGKLSIGYTPALPSGQGIYLAYLDVWERHLTWLDDPKMREVALLGPDTTTRTKTAWQVKLLSVQSDEANKNCQSHFSSWDQLIATPTGTLQARAEPTEPAKEPCELPPQAGYRRLQNQLYRVEIHDEGTSNNGATFKWSRENGSIVTRALDVISSGSKIIVSDTGRDSKLGFVHDEWVEVIDDRRELWGLPGTLVKLGDIPDNNTLNFDPATVKGDAITNENFPQEFNPKIRRWDSVSALKILIPADNDGYIELEDGVQVKFSNGTYKTGDFWLIPARTATTNVEWPKVGASNDPATLPPHGITHHFCRLALLEHADGLITLLDDCRHFFTPASALTLHYVSGDGQESAEGKVLPSELRAFVTTGDEPVRGVKVQFQIQLGNGTLDPPEVTDPKTCIATSDENGFVSCHWRLGTEPSTQQVKATLLDINSNPILLPLYFNANITELETVATTGIITLNFDSAIPLNQNRVIFGTFKHFLEGKVSSPPAIMLGLASDPPPGNQKESIMFMEDYDHYMIKDTALKFKAVGIDLSTFKISLPTPVVSELIALERKIGLRWWAVPAQEEEDQEGKPIETPTIVFDPNILTMNLPSRVIVDDVSVNTRPDVEEALKFKLLTTDPESEAGAIPIEAIETGGPNTGKFETREKIQVVDQNTVVVGDNTFQLIGAKPGGSLVARYETTAADGRQTTITAEAKITQIDFPAPTIAFEPDTIIFMSGESTTIRVTDASANMNSNLAENISVILGTNEVEQFREIISIETGPNTGMFAIVGIQVEGLNRVSIPNEPPFDLPGVNPNGTLIATYRNSAGIEVRATAKIIPPIIG
jgi:hypothetical protein